MEYDLQSLSSASSVFPSGRSDVNTTIPINHDSGSSSASSSPSSSRGERITLPHPTRSFGLVFGRFKNGVNILRKNGTHNKPDDHDETNTKEYWETVLSFANAIALCGFIIQLIVVFAVVDYTPVFYQPMYYYTPTYDTQSKQFTAGFGLLSQGGSYMFAYTLVIFGFSVAMRAMMVYFSTTYMHSIRTGKNPVYWLETGVVGTTSALLTAISSGVVEYGLLFIVSVLIVLHYYLLYLTETLNRSEIQNNSTKVSLVSTASTGGTTPNTSSTTTTTTHRKNAQTYVPGTIVDLDDSGSSSSSLSPLQRITYWSPWIMSIICFSCYAMIVILAYTANSDTMATTSAVALMFFLILYLTPIAFVFFIDQYKLAMARLLFGTIAPSLIVWLVFSGIMAR